MQQETATPPRLTYTRVDIAEQLNISIGKLDRLIAAGDLAVLRIGRRVVVPHASLEAFVAQNTRTAR